MKTIYHVFADRTDEFYDSRKDAEDAYGHLEGAGHENLRLYKELIDEKGDMVSEDCLKATGEFPF